MPRPIDPAKRYLANTPCPHDGTHERYVRSDDCCACQARYQRNADAVGRIHNTARRIKPAEPRQKVIHDPTKGAVFADSIRHLLRAGHA